MKPDGAIWLEPVRNEIEDRWDYLVIKTKNTLHVIVGEQLTKDAVKEAMLTGYDVTITQPKG